MTIRFLAESEAELDDAVAYYDAQVEGLGLELVAEVQRGLAHIEKFPEGWKRLDRRLRRYRLRRFPYGLIYAVLPTEIAIVAVMHLHRAPDYWRERLKKL